MTLNVLRVETDAQQYERGATAELKVTALSDGQTASGALDVALNGSAVGSVEHGAATDGETVTMTTTVDLPDEDAEVTIAVGDESTTVAVGEVEEPERPLGVTRTIDGDHVTVSVDVPSNRNGLSFIERFRPPLSERPEVTTRPSGSSVITVPAKKGIIVGIRGTSDSATLEYRFERDDEEHTVDFYTGDDSEANVTGDTTIPERQSSGRFEDMSRDELVQLLLDLLGDG